MPRQWRVFDYFLHVISVNLFPIQLSSLVKTDLEFNHWWQIRDAQIQNLMREIRFKDESTEAEYSNVAGCKITNVIEGNVEGQHWAQSGCK